METEGLANNKQEGVDAVKEACYDAVLMDVQMPVMRIKVWKPV